MDGATTKRKRWIRFILLIIGIPVIAGLLLNTLFFSRATVISPIPDTPIPKASSAPKTFTLFKKQKSADDLTDKINNAVDETWNDYSVVVEDYTSDFSLRISEGEIFVAASVNKIPILAALYYYAGKGEIDLDRDITVQAADIQDYGTGSLRYEEPGAVYSVKTLAKLMIKQSDNTAAYILANHIVGFKKLKEITAQWGLVQTDMVDNKTSNQDIAKLMRMIYEGKVTDAAHTQEMLSFLKDTDHETRLPALLPEGVTIYHKIGTEVGVIHDAGIITDGKHTYYLGIFTNGTAEGEETDKHFAEISKIVYDYMK